jgi:hypothetical protein
MKTKEDFIKYCKENIKKEKGIMLNDITFPEEGEDMRLFFSCTKEEFCKQFISENETCYSYNGDYERIRDFEECLESAFEDFFSDCTYTEEFQKECEDIKEEDIF